MSFGFMAARTLQWGLETTRGTAVAATSKIAVEDIVFTGDDLVVRPKTSRGILVRNPGDEEVVTRGTSFSVPETPLVWNQFQHWLSMSLKAPVMVDGGATVTWTCTRTLTADPAPDTRTLERRLSDGTNFIDNEWAYAFLSQLRIIQATDQLLRFSAEGFARRIQSSTLTAGQALPSSGVLGMAPSALGLLWIDSTWATIATTGITGAQIQGYDLTINTGLKPKMSLDGRSDLDFTTYVFDPSEFGFDLTIRMLVKTDSGQFATEKTAAEAQTLRAIRSKLTDGSNYLQIDLLAKHVPGSLQTIASEDGQDLVEMQLTDATDATNQLAVVLQNTTTNEG